MELALTKFIVTTLTKNASLRAQNRAGKKAIAALTLEYGEPFAVFWKNGIQSDIELAEESFLEAYRGEFASAEAYVEDIFNEICGAEIEALPSLLQHCIDWKYAAEEIERGGDLWTDTSSRGTVYVFGSV